MQDAVKFQSWEFLETYFGDQKSQWEMKRENANHDSQTNGTLAERKIGKIGEKKLEGVQKLKCQKLKVSHIFLA